MRMLDCYGTRRGACDTSDAPVAGVHPRLPVSYDVRLLVGLVAVGRVELPADEVSVLQALAR